MRGTTILSLLAFGVVGIHVKYQVVNCGNREAQTVQALETLIGALPAIIEDVKKSVVNPSEAYRAFFKDPTNTPFIVQVLTDAITGVPKRPPFPGWSDGGPTFLCINEPGITMAVKGNIVDAFTVCSDPMAGIFAQYNSPTPFILLCPRFFEMRLLAPSLGNSDCPILSRRFNGFRKKPNEYFVGSSVIDDFQWTLLEEIVHYYLYVYKDTAFSLEPEVYDINEAWKLSPIDSLANAASWAYYASSQYTHLQLVKVAVADLWLVAVHARCSNWPDPRSR
ncbi:MAG: hypothetical protein Q9221_004816 [Calogaya cf. arnoldii]